MSSRHQPRASLASVMRAVPADYGRVRGLRRQPEAHRLVSIGRNPGGRPVRLTPHAASAWRRMRATAARDGIELLAISGFRSIRRQAGIIRGKLATGARRDDILKTVAAPGYSEHHTGRAVDIGTPGETLLTESFAQTPAFRWLKAHAGTHGFRLSYPRGNRHGIVYEPWHWCWHA